MNSGSANPHCRSYHGVPRLYAGKSDKWVAEAEERNGYHMNGGPRKEERYGW